ncbi:hypothetical protein E4L96_05695 [Massilia arenosa]|uniref:Uncharacterized protein n=1 Tax=Zemynaea arenosa TaxID=2561931 RepID=A0A4Y9SIC7_9BURK|nr:hypothetical protein [Massilia arenosa]TFW25023.1 hypothetical protein E4L96_05695 [Massilia arenosa]
MKTAFKFLKTLLIDPVRGNVALALFLIGITLIVLASLDIGWPARLAAILQTIGTTLLGGGVFAVIMKSAQFSDLFQQRIADVIYDPARIEDAQQLPQKWRLLTNAILKQVLPSTYDTAAAAIEQRYFTRELDYHFENYEATYDIAIDPKTGTATVTSTLRAQLMISPNKKTPCFEQTIRSDSPSRLTSLIINDSPVAVSDDAFKDEDGWRVLRVQLATYAVGHSYVKLERTFLTAQSKKEPFVSATVTRFTKGAVIRVKISDGYEVRMLSIGFDDYVRSDAPDGQGFTRWTLAPAEGLLLPGQGYTLVFVPTN